jgi:hypothetical protein
MAHPQQQQQRSASWGQVLVQQGGEGGHMGAAWGADRGRWMGVLGPSAGVGLLGRRAWGQQSK